MAARGDRPLVRGRGIRWNGPGGGPLTIDPARMGLVRHWRCGGAPIHWSIRSVRGPWI